MSYGFVWFVALVVLYVLLVSLIGQVLGGHDRQD